MKKLTASDMLKSGIKAIYERYRYSAVTTTVLLIFAVAAMTCSISKPDVTASYDSFAAGTGTEVPVYIIGTDRETSSAKAVEVSRLVRGTPVTSYESYMEADGVRYTRVETEEKKAADEEGFEPWLFIREDQLADSREGVVKEKEVFVRTPATIYAEESGPAIASFAPKSSCLTVTGYDRLNSDGSVNKYRVQYTSDDGEAKEGFVYGKYMTDTQEKADAVYNENGIYDRAVKDKFSFNLHGGKAKNLDYYPYEKPVIEGNEFCADARAMYINCAAAVNPEPYVKIIKSTDCNSVVIDIKDGVLAYRSDVAKELSPKSYKTAYVSEEEYKKGVDAYRDTGVYLIGRIVVFNDPIYAKDHPEDCIKYGGSRNWPSAYSRDVWEYNVRLAQEAIEKFGFNEIQFDYVRFPESSYEMSKSGKTDFRNRYGEEKGQAVQNFCFYAADQIHEAGAYFSVDVFGESAYGYMTAYGQYWPGISNIVDAISAMPYTDHMGDDGAWENPYRTVKKWAKKAKAQQDKLENPAAARTWITGYDTPYWAPEVQYGPKRLRQQRNALVKAGLTGGFIPWNSGSSVKNYRHYKAVWKID